jgi:dTDP-4-dehydrorhamnose 3,5-epimerase
MHVEELSLSGLKLIRPRIFEDQRGFFLESYNFERYAAAGIDCVFVQDNHSRSVKGTLRGLHYQASPGQAKLLRVAAGRIFDVAVDIRPESPTFGKWDGVVLDGESHQQLFIPVGFAHGFCVLSDSADVLYKVSSVYVAATERGIRYDDPEIGVAWPVEAPIVSERDRNAESFADFRRRAQGL